MPGGPETAAALGRPYIPSTTDGIEATRMDTIPADRSVTPAANRTPAGGIDIEGAIESAAPPVPATGDPSGSRGGVRVSLNEPQMPEVRLTNQDFYGQPNPDTIQTRTGPVPVASYGQVPLGVLGMQMAKTQQERAKTRDAIENFDLYSGIGKAPTPYQRNFNELATRDMDQFLSKVVNMYGGDRAAAVRDLSDKTSDLNMRWRKRSAQWEQIGQQAEFKFKQASDLLDAAETGKIQLSDDGRKVAQEALNGIGEFGGPNGGDVMELAETLRRFDQIMSREQYINDFALPGIEAHMKERGIAPTTTRNKYGQRVTTYGTEKDLAPFREQAAKDMAWRGIGEGNTVKERIANNLKALEAALPSDQEIKVDVSNPPSSSSSGSGSTVQPKMKVSTGMSMASRLNLGESQNVVTKPDQRSWTMVPTISFSEEVGDKSMPMAPRVFDGAAGQVTIEAPELKYVQGHWRIVGRSRNVINESTDVDESVSGARSRVRGGSGATDKEQTSSKEGRMEFLDYDKNLPRIRTYLGDDFDVWSVVRQKAEEKGQVWDQAAFDKLPNGTRQKVVEYLFK